MKHWHKQALIGLVIIVTPFLLLKLQGRNISFEKELKVQAHKQTGDCLPITMTTLLEEKRLIMHPVIQFAFVKDGVLKSIGETDLVFKGNPAGRYVSSKKQEINTCLQFRSIQKRDKLISSVSQLPPPYQLQCKLLIAVQEPGKDVKHHYGTVFICKNKLKQ